MIKCVGDKILIKADAILGTEEEEATIVEVTGYGYIVAPVSCSDWTGPIDFDGNVLQEF